jgi:putative transposase
MRFLWNIAQEQRLMGLARPRDERVYPSAYDQQKEFTLLRRELPWLSDVPYEVAQRVLVDLDLAWQKCFKRITSAPRWKRRGDALSFTTGNPKSWYVRNGELRFPKLGRMPIVLHRSLVGERRTCTVVQDGDQWFVCIVCALETPIAPARTTPVVALDRGVTATFATSDGRFVTNPKHYEKALERLAHAQRVVSRRKKGSKNREKAKLRVMRIHRKVRRQREHFLHVESARLTKSHGVVVIEKLNVAGLARGRGAQGILSAGWSTFAEFLRYKLTAAGGFLLEVDARYSSQTCSACGAIDAASRCGRLYHCTSCGFIDHADLNAAKVLLSRANRSALPAEGTALEAARRNRKEVVTLRTPRTKTTSKSVRSLRASITSEPAHLDFSPA